ncbi:MAG: fibronectin type III domain-containing protein, partial [Chloroflexi bacterium]|nr:fibronectin type III domain-containing protein [Chloroflexota bacterium]
MNQSSTSAEVTCQGTAGTQTVSLVATDAVHTTLSAAQTVRLRVSVPKLAAPTGLSVTAEVTKLTLGWQLVSGATGYEVRLDGGAETKLGATTTSHPFPGLTPSTKYGLEVRAYTGADHSLWANIEGTTTAPEVLVLTAAATPTSCETDGQVTVSWTVTGGSGSHTVSVDGSAQSGSSVQVVCQEAAGTQHVTVTATDATYRQLTATKTLSLTVSKPAPPATVEAQIRARRLSDHRVEFALRLGGGSDLTTAKRYLKLPEVTAGRWYASGAYTATVAGVDYTLGVVSARLDNTVCPARVEVTFIPTGGERITPEQYKFTVDREADLWALTSKFALPLQASSDSVRTQADSGALMTEAPTGAVDGPGREGGLMFGDPAPAVDMARAGDAETVCTAQPTGLTTSAVSSSGARLAWGKVTGASEYDTAVGEGAYTELASATLTHEFTGLAADTEHTLRVRARSWRGSSKWSASVVRT